MKPIPRCKRTHVPDARDSYGNQEVSYLSQRIEDSNRMIMLATNLNQFQQAFARGFQSIIDFQKQDGQQLWQ